MPSNAMDVIERAIKELVDALGTANSKLRRDEIAGQTIFSIETEDDARALIGPHGDTVHALDLLVKKIVEKRLPPPEGVAEGETSHSFPLFFLDVNGYRTKQIKDLQTKALMMAERARSFQYDVELNPMSAYERLIIHTTLQDAPNIKTESQGEGRNRRVVIKYTS